MIPVTTPIVARLANTLIPALNNYTEMRRDLCEKLKLAQIFWAMKMIPNDNLLKFKKNADIDGFVADMSAKMKITIHVYQIKVLVTPGNSIFEATISHFVDTDRMDLNLTDVSRVNMYEKQAKCIESTFPNLRKYCYCRE